MDTVLSPTAKPWERREGETPKAYEAFQTYLFMGPQRSLAKLAAKRGTSRASLGHLELWSSKFKWVERVRAWDAQQCQVQEQALTDARYQTVFADTINKDRTLREAARVGYSDIRRVAQWDSDGLVLKNSNELSEEDAAAIKKIKFNKKQGLVEIETHDKMKAVELLGRNQRAWDEERAGTTNNYVAVITAVQRGEYDDLLRKAFPGIELPEPGAFMPQKKVE